MSPAWTVWMGITALVPRVFVVLVGAAIRGGLLLMLAAAVVYLWPRASAAQRHVVWVVVYCCLLLLPVLPLVIPAWHVSMPVLPATVAPMLNKMQGTTRDTVSMAVIAAADHNASPGLAMTADRPVLMPVWLLVVLGVWGSVTLIVLTVLVDNRRRARRLVSDTLPLTDVRMLAVLARAKDAARVTRRVSVTLHVSTGPMVCGVLRSTVVLPASARTWDEDRLYNILLHELAHIKRYDCLTQTMAFVACAVYWFNPLVWWAVRRLQTEQEQACDDVVLLAGSRARAYATDLLELTKAFQPTSAFSLVALPFARPSELRTRMRSIIDRSRPRSVMSRWGALAVWGMGLGVMYPLVGLTPQLRNAEIRPLISTLEHGKMNTTKKTAMIASAVAGLLTPVARQAQAPVATQAWVDSLYQGAKTAQDSARSFFSSWASEGNSWAVGCAGGRDSLNMKWIDTYYRCISKGHLDSSYTRTWGREVARNEAEPNKVHDSVLVLVDGVRRGVFPLNGIIPFDQMKLIRGTPIDQLHLISTGNSSFNTVQEIVDQYPNMVDHYHIYRGGHWAVVLYGPDAANGVIDIQTEGGLDRRFIAEMNHADSVGIWSGSRGIKPPKAWISCTWGDVFDYLQKNKLRDSVLVLIDSMPRGMYSINDHISFNKLNITYNDVDEMKTTTGQWAVARYGVDAAHGVVNIITKSP